ncbi:MAG: iron-containing alcohol dehydrogenase [Candidatus Rokubacteria bacterium]|nr:iron-containing alcohol dehydrogenase [Candidatus Rokubacteria bacterium]
MSQAFVHLPVDRVIYGAGSLADLPKEIDRLAVQRAFVVTGQSLATKTEWISRVQDLLGDRCAGVFARASAHVPKRTIVEAAAEARAAQADCLVSVGGGSPIDTAKGVALALAEEIRDEAGLTPYAGWHGRGKEPFAASGPLPHIAIPTTLSAGEHSGNFGMTDEAARRKDGAGHPLLVPRVVVLDPEITRDTPEWLWTSTGIRALDHAVERFYTPSHQPLTDVLCLEAIRLLVRELPVTLHTPANLEARLACQLAAWFSLFGAFNARTGLSHAIGHQLGGRCGVPHGQTSCVILPHVMVFNVPAAADRLAQIGEAAGVMMEGRSTEDAARAAAKTVARIIKALGCPTRLTEVGVTEADLRPLAQATFDELRPGMNPRVVRDPEEILEILKAVL